MEGARGALIPLLIKYKFNYLNWLPATGATLKTLILDIANTFGFLPMQNLPLKKRPYPYRMVPARVSQAQPPMRRRRLMIPRRRAPLYRAPGALGRTSLTEVKSFDLLIIPLGIALTPIGGVAGGEPGGVWAGMTELNCIRQDATVSGRIGDKIVVRSIHYRGTLSCSNPAAFATARVLIVYDKQCNGVFPAIGDILFNLPGGASVYGSSINISNKNRFIILRDRFFWFDPGTGLSKQIDEFIFAKLEVQYGANAGTIADFRMGAIYLIAFYGNITAGAITIGNNWSRIRYYD